MFSQVFVLNERGDSLIFRKYRGDVEGNSTEVFYNRIRTTRDSQPPCFNINGVHYIYIHTAGLYFVLNTKKQVSPNFVLEFLQRFAAICKDYCGTLNENSIQQNFVLIYEILDEVLNYGYIQETSTQALKPFIHTQPKIIEPYNKAAQFSSGNLFGIDKLHISGDPSKRSVVQHDQIPKKGEIFSDIVEQLLVQIDEKGNVIRSEIIGSVTVRSFLPDGCVLQFSFSENLYRLHQHNGSGLRLEDYTFHPSVSCEDFEDSGKLSVISQLGEHFEQCFQLRVMNYRMSGNASVESFPFNVKVIPEDSDSSRIKSVCLQIRCSISSEKYAHHIEVHFSTPRDTESVSCPGQDVEFSKETGVAIWRISQCQGGSTMRALLKLHGEFEENFDWNRELKSVNLCFEIPSYLYSKAKVRSLRVFGGSGRIEITSKWNRYITYSDSFMTRW
ncbi:AP-4 complex subunit mu-like isoform X2 [Xenia sp. Carnegie-2017]|uniref:AP-4 complex subunit mu-like isoform X2 n=1 Tax=Xenia sp. Carnegie-2017 TaxID=2897299 RepID=UPI001F036FC8|nr:AP-4 complex subunit mu-like isoform X2 [Xenia sp. Carnegie-2017]